MGLDSSAMSQCHVLVTALVYPVWSEQTSPPHSPWSLSVNVAVFSRIPFSVMATYASIDSLSSES